MRNYAGDGWRIFARDDVSDELISLVLGSVDGLGECGKRFRGRGAITVSSTSGEHRLYSKSNRLRVRPSKFLKCMEELRKGRFLREGRMYMEFHSRRIPTPRLVFFGDRTLLGFRVEEIIVTELVEGRNILDLYRESRDECWIHRVSDLLARIHGSGMAHGDCMLHNFFFDGESVLAMDLERSSSLTNESRLNDLVEYGGAILRVTGEVSLLRDAMSRYLKTSDPEGQISFPELIERCIRWG